MSSPIGGTGARLGSEAMSQLARDLNRMGAAGRRNLQARMAALASPLLSDARTRASWSSRIPGAISVRATTDTTRGRVGVQLRVSVEEAPHARAYEGLSDGGTAGSFRHPLFGDREVWFTQRTRPYAWPAVVAKGDAVSRALGDAFEDAAREVGFH